MSLMWKFVCDRCGTSKEMAKNEPPKGWGPELAKDLCVQCRQDLDAFLRGAKIEYAAVKPSGEAS